MDGILLPSAWCVTHCVSVFVFPDDYCYCFVCVSGVESAVYRLITDCIITTIIIRCVFTDGHTMHLLIHSALHAVCRPDADLQSFSSLSGRILSRGIQCLLGKNSWIHPVIPFCPGVRLKRKAGKEGEEERPFCTPSRLVNGKDGKIARRKDATTTTTIKHRKSL